MTVRKKQSKAKPAPRKKPLTDVELAAQKKAGEERKAATREAAIKLEQRRIEEYGMWVAGGSYRAIAAQISKRGVTITKTTVENDIKLIRKRDAISDQQLIVDLKEQNRQRLQTMILSHWNPALKDRNVAKVVGGLIKQINDMYGLNEPIKIENSGSLIVRQAVDLSNVSQNDLLLLESILKKAEESKDAA